MFQLSMGQPIWQIASASSRLHQFVAKDLSDVESGVAGPAHERRPALLAERQEPAALAVLGQQRFLADAAQGEAVDCQLAHVHLERVVVRGRLIDGVLLGSVAGFLEAVGEDVVFEDGQVFITQLVQIWKSFKFANSLLLTLAKALLWDQISYPF